MKRYTLWKGTASGKGEAILLIDEPLYKTKIFAFKRAKKLSLNLAKGWDNAILVRLVTLGSDLCREWVFPSD